MPTREAVMDTIRLAIKNLVVTVKGVERRITVTESLFNPRLVPPEQMPKVAVVPGPDPINPGLYGYSIDHESFQIDVFGYTFGGSLIKTGVPANSDLYRATEDMIRVIIAKLTNPTWVNNVNCAFSILKIGPVTSEHADGEDVMGYISIPLTVTFFQDSSE